MCDNYVKICQVVRAYTEDNHLLLIFNENSSFAVHYLSLHKGLTLQPKRYMHLFYYTINKKKKI